MDDSLEHLHDLPLPNPSKQKYKSWRKKYRKMRQHFDDRMEEANNLFIATHRLQEIADRLQEQNDQLLEILTDLNTSHKVPSTYRYDIQLPDDPSLPSPLSNHTRTEARDGAIKLVDLESVVPHTTYALAIGHSGLPSDLLDRDGNPPDGYLTPKHEEDYLAIIDNALDVIPLPSPSKPNIILDPSVDLRPRHPSPPTERDFAIQNPVSVHNWLLRHKPAIKLEQERDGNSDRLETASVTGAATAPPKKGKGGRKEKTKEDAPFEGLDDEIGFDAEEERGKKGKRKSGDGDHTYRPKGGRSKAAKRKRGGDEEEPEGKTLKKARSMVLMDPEVEG